MQLLSKCFRGNKIELHWHVCLTLLSNCAEGVQFYCLFRPYPAIHHGTIFPFLGRIAEQGTYEQLLADGGEFADFLVQYLTEEVCQYLLSNLFIGI